MPSNPHPCRPRSLNQPTPAVVRGGGGGGRKFLALDAPGTVLVATGRDPAIYEYAGAMRQATNEWASGACGRRAAERVTKIGAQQDAVLPVLLPLGQR